MMRKSRHLLCAALVLCLLMSLAPVTALAVNVDVPDVSMPAAEGIADNSAISAVIGDGAVSISDAPAEDGSLAVDMAPGDYIDRELYDTDFGGRDGAVWNLSEAMIARKNEIYIYWRSDIALTEEHIDQLMSDALLLEGNLYGGSYLAFHVLDYYAEWQHIEQDGSFYNIIGFAVAYSTTAEQELELMNAIENLYGEVVGDNNNRYLRVLNIYNYIVDHVEYDMDNAANLDYLRQHTAYAAMIDGKASAIGYSLLFHLMTNRFDVKSDIVMGEIDGNAFVWNAVELFGRWYQVNVGFDEAMGTKDCFLLGTDDLPAGHKLMDEFLTPEFQAEYPMAKTKFDPATSVGGKAGDNARWNYNLLTEEFVVSGSGRMYDDLYLNGEAPVTKELPLVVEEGITYIGQRAFADCRFDKVTLPASLTEIGAKAFVNSDVKTVVGGENVTVIGESAFENCEWLSEITLPKALQTIGNAAFRNCRLLNVAELPDNLETIGEQAFYHVPIAEVELPAKVKSIGFNAFYSEVFTGYAVDKKNPDFSAEKGVLYNKDQTALLAVPNLKVENFTIPETVTDIGEKAFYNCGWIDYLVLHEGITYIAPFAFAGSNLRLIVLPSSLSSISYGAFSSDALKSIYIPPSITYIGDGAFANCYFYDAYYGGTEEQWAQIEIMGNNSALNNIEKQSHKVGEIGSWTLDLDKMELELTSFNFNVWQHWKDEIKSVVLTDAGQIPDEAFKDFTALQYLTIRSEYTVPGVDSFAGCTALTDVYYSEMEHKWVEKGFDKAFPDSPNLTVHCKEVAANGPLGDNLQWSYSPKTRTLTISGQGPMRDFETFEAHPWDEWMDDGNGYNVVIEEGVTSVGAYAFYGRKMNVKFASTIEHIGEGAFQNADLGRLMLNEGLKTVGDAAFWGAEIESRYDNEVGTVKPLILPSTLERIESNGMNVSNPTVVYIPASIRYLGGYAVGSYHTKVHYAGSEAQWQQVQVHNDNYDSLKYPAVYNAGCPHVTETILGKPATCMETGMTDGVYCVYCGMVTQEQQVIEKTSHRFEDNTCVHCGMVIDPDAPVSGKIGKNANWAFDINTAKLTVSGEGDIPDYNAAKDVPWSAWSGEVLTVELSSGLTAVGNNAFTGFAKLREVSYDSTLWKWQQMEIGSGNEALTDAKLITAEVFTDVLTADWFYGPVNWAVASNVTGGIGNGQFGPNNFCTRAQVVTFLYAAAGKPEVTTTENPFEDVADDAWYAKPVLWAVENGITSGIDATHFGPDVTCTRAQVVTFLYAAKSKPEITASSTFTDVADTDWYAKPVIWAKENDVTGGISATEFGPNQTCTRAQVVTFLYKVYG